MIGRIEAWIEDHQGAALCVVAVLVVLAGWS